MTENWSLYHPEIPEFLRRLAETPPMARLRQVGMNCGCEYTSFPRFAGWAPYSRFDHSLGVALIVWHFTGDLRQSAAGLLHDVATPAFAHVVDFLHGDHLRQESTEARTAELIGRSPELQALLGEYGLTTEDVADYHRYPIADNDSPQLSADRLEDTPGIAFKIFSLLARNNVNVDIILQSIGRNSSKDISFTVARSDAEEARAILEENRDYIGFQSIEVNTQVAKVSIVGAGMVNNSGVACKMFEALSSAGINISMISTSEIKVSVLVDERDADRAVQAIHDRFFSEFGNS